MLFAAHGDDDHQNMLLLHVVKDAKLTDPQFPSRHGIWTQQLSVFRGSRWFMAELRFNRIEDCASISRG